MKATVIRGLNTVGIDHRRIRRIRWITKARLLHQSDARVRDNLSYMFGPDLDMFSFDLANEDELADWIADLLGAERGHIAELIIESRSHPWLVDLPPLGRRVGWYVLTRLVRPERVIETGIHDGIGSRVLLAALDRNGAGELVSFDVWEGAGSRVGKHPRWDRRITGTQDGLPPAFAEAPVQIFLHDSLHTYAHERMELDIASGAMTSGLLLSDNSHDTTALADVARELRLPYHFFQERPRQHFYRGAGIGAVLLGLPAPEA